MEIESLPSKNAAILDVPEIDSFRANFQYFYWTADEFENGLGSSEAAKKQLPSETFDASYVSQTRKLPRLVKLSWNPITINRDKSKPENPISIREFLTKLHDEETFTSSNYTTFHYQDTGADLRLKFFIDKFASLLPELSNTNSPDELIALINSRTSDQVTAKFLAEIISDLSRHGVSFNSKNQTSTALLERIKNVALNSRLNNRILVPIVKTITEDSVGIFADEFSSNSFQENIKSIQDIAIANASANIISHSDYDFEILSYVDYKPVDSNGYEPAVQTLGYIIDKKEIRADGSIEQHPPIIVENSFVSTTFDAQVRYGSVYFYKIRVVYLIETRAVDEASNQNLLVSFLAGSKFTPEQKVVTIENVPPPPPSDFNVAWDYGEKCLRCTWNLPNNQQQDVKYIQLFKRKSIADPFQLIKMWDFNDTNTRVALNEYPLPELVERVPSFVGIHLDHEFGKDSNNIYAVAAVDAHSLCSNYSIQFQVFFDRFENRLVKKLVSVSGAPKQYPNAYLNADTFVDTIRDSGHTNMQIIFNPDYLNIVNGEGADVSLLKTNRVNGKYRLQMINVDLQSQQNIDIVLQDSRITSMRIPTNSNLNNRGAR